MTAVRLLSAQTNKRLLITLVDDKRSVARGIAYRSDDEGWLLNAPARALSAERSNPNDFVDYCHRQGHRADPNDFLPRAWYGDYLAYLLQKAVQTSGGHKLHQHDGRVVALKSAEDGRTTVHLQTGAQISADQVVLATGQDTGCSSATTVFDDNSLGRRFIKNPWDAVQLQDVPANSHFFMSGSGLTALDLVHALHRRVAGARFTLMSRRGLLPQQHRQVTPMLSLEARHSLLDELANRPRHCAAAVRRAVAEHRARDGDWREVIDCMRPSLPHIWSRWSDADRRAFVRHLAPYWDTHRHRHPPGAAALMAELRARGLLSLLSGRIETIKPGDDELLLTIRLRSNEESRVVQASYLVNCTGAGTAAARSNPMPDKELHASGSHLDQAPTCDPLFDQLRRDGLAKFDWGGLCVDESYRAISVDGRTNPSLSYVGPALKSRYWEATAIPELLIHIERMIEVINQRYATG
jgi:uncharacterized NAD(P)/FAD-binding protein YdhS